MSSSWTYILFPTHQWAKMITFCMFIWKKLPFWPPKSFMEHLESSRDCISIHTGLISNMNHKQCKTPWTWSELTVRSPCSWRCPKFLWKACACNYRLWCITEYTSSFCTALIAVKCSFISFQYGRLHEVITFSEWVFGDKSVSLLNSRRKDGPNRAWMYWIFIVCAWVIRVTHEFMLSTFSR